MCYHCEYMKQIADLYSSISAGKYSNFGRYSKYFLGNGTKIDTLKDGETIDPYCATFFQLFI